MNSKLNLVINKNIGLIESSDSIPMNDILNQYITFSSSFHSPKRGIDIFSDESIIQKNEQYAISFITIDHEERRRKEPMINFELRELIKRYNLKNIHFVDILGRKNVLKSRKVDFLIEYAKIVSKIDITCFSGSYTKSEFIEECLKKKILKVEEIKLLKEEDILNALFWNGFWKLIIPFYKNYKIFSLYRENSNYIYDRNNNRFNNKGATLSLMYHNWGTKHTINFEKDIAVNKYPFYFNKNSLLSSSTSDLIAYYSNNLEALLRNNNISEQKKEKMINKNEHQLALSLIKESFQNTTNLKHVNPYLERSKYLCSFKK